GGDSYTAYTGLLALLINIAVASVVQLAMGKRGAVEPAAPVKA
ncbi:MAG: hypothetical protein JWP38_2774, partial [Herbaspirillum sp.]|nr:hypothetical protein [Herbaspirillum sp.]